MRGFEASSTITAEPAAIWAVLTDGSGWTGWDSAVARFEGTNAPGEKVTVLDLGPSFRRFADGLKKRVESSTS